MKPEYPISVEVRNLVSALVDGRLDEPQKARLEDLVIQDRDARQYYLESMYLVGQLQWELQPRLRSRCDASSAQREAAEGDASRPARSSAPGFFDGIGRRAWGKSSGRRRVVLCGAAAVVAGLLMWMIAHPRPAAPRDAGGPHQAASEQAASEQAASEQAPSATAPAARLAAADCRWVDAGTTLDEGATLTAGQKLELASGRVEVVFQSGARVQLWGPAIFEIESGNSGFLTIGRLNARADTPESRGFTIHSRTSSAVDLGTEFSVQAAADGHSQVNVSSGVVEVTAAKAKSPYRLRQGESIEVEPGNPSVVARIEPGDDTPAFNFPTIERPSAKDYADKSQGHASVRVVEGRLAPDSGPVELLLDGKAQSVCDAPSQSVFFANGTTGKVLLDLGKNIAVERINTYSWHQKYYKPENRGRAPQKYFLYGASGPQPPAVTGDLAANGWKLIARVNTDEFFSAPETAPRPPQQGVSIRGVNGPVGNYRYLLWDVRLSRPEVPEAKELQCTFFGEFDVYGQ